MKRNKNIFIIFLIKKQINKLRIAPIHPQLKARAFPQLLGCFRIGKALSRFRRHCGFWTEDQPLLSIDAVWKAYSKEGRN